MDPHVTTELRGSVIKTAGDRLDWCVGSCLLYEIKGTGGKGTVASGARDDRVGSLMSVGATCLVLEYI